MMFRMGIAALTLMFCLGNAALAQVDIADKGESGVGVGLGGAFSSGASAYGFNASGTLNGLVDIGFTFTYLSDGNTSGPAAGGQVTFLPLRSVKPEARWSLGGLVTYDVGRPGSQDIIMVGGLVTLDLQLSPTSDFQIAGSYAIAKTSASRKKVSIVTIAPTIVAKRFDRKLYVSGSISIPSEGVDPVFGIQVGTFLKSNKDRGRR